MTKALMTKALMTKALMTKKMKMTKALMTKKMKMMKMMKMMKPISFQSRGLTTTTGARTTSVKKKKGRQWAEGRVT